MKSRDIQIAEAVRDACVERFISERELREIVASIPAPEPVAWKHSKRYGSGLSFQKPEPPEEPSDLDEDGYCIPLYTAPPAANPTAILELLDRLEAAERDAARYIAFCNYLVSDRTDLDEAFIAANNKTEIDAVLDSTLYQEGAK